MNEQETLEKVPSGDDNHRTESGWNVEVQGSAWTEGFHPFLCRPRYAVGYPSCHMIE